MPFYDALTSGYVIRLPFDLELRKIDNGIFLRWKTEESLVTTHAEEQAPLLPKPFGNEQGVVFKFGFEYVIKTPPGYSTLFTHPFNQHDLPFRTFSGVVDTDVFTLPVLFPFQVLDVFEDLYIVKQGTPVVQMIPFKRENWNKKVIKYNSHQTKINTINYLSTIVSAYKSKFWHRKSYK